VDDAADHSTVIHSMRARLVFWQQRIDRRPLPVRQPELSSHDPTSVQEIETQQEHVTQ
jgi:hypothetical protein